MRKPELDAPSPQSMEGHLQTNMEMLVDNNNNGDVVSLRGKYVFVAVMCLVLSMCILTSCSSVLCVLMALGMFMFVKFM